MKKLLTLLLTFSLAITFGQQRNSASIPTGYYNTATGTGYTLKTQLFNIINGHNDRGYSGLYTTYNTSDKDFYYENDGTMLDNYTENPTGAECEFTYGTGQDDGTLGNNECERYNREHLVPQSVFGSATPMYSDAHFVLPSDKHVNAQRGDLPFGKVNVVNWTSVNGTKRGSNLNAGYSAGYTGTVFEPIDEFKGDIARCLLYFATRYEDVVAGYTYPMFNNTSDQVFNPTFLNILLTWNNNDPVSQREIDRNNAIYARQNNRNPYIDHPEYVCRVWSTACTALSDENFAVLENTISVFPNPTNNHTITISSYANLEAIQLITINGQLFQEIKNPSLENNSYTLENLPSGFYLMKITTAGKSITKKVIVN
ncbi:endonuclease [Flavobacterium sp.]|uniref:endonuclease n=1 Tax=Flavobacterium sp. TaxID=239 RepID=UPI002631E555|nr:endonuclease [Flavobacterium sp.]